MPTMAEVQAMQILEEEKAEVVATIIIQNNVPFVIS